MNSRSRMVQANRRNLPRSPLPQKSLQFSSMVRAVSFPPIHRWTYPPPRYGGETGGCSRERRVAPRAAPDSCVNSGGANPTERGDSTFQALVCCKGSQALGGPLFSWLWVLRKGLTDNRCSWRKASRRLRQRVLPSSKRCPRILLQRLKRLVIMKASRSSSMPANL